MLSVCCISSKISYSCTVQGRGIPLRGLTIVLRQFILTHVVKFWPKYWFITWVNPSGEYSLLGSDSLFGSEQLGMRKLMYYAISSLNLFPSNSLKRLSISAFKSVSRYFDHIYRIRKMLITCTTFFVNLYTSKYQTGRLSYALSVSVSWKKIEKGH